MVESRKHWHVNWIDGMKISRRHFEEQFRANQDQFKDLGGLSVTPWSYGVLNGKTGGFEAFAGQISLEENDRIHVEITQCRAITPSGLRIEYLAIDNDGPFKQTLSLSKEEAQVAGTHYVVLTSNPFTGVASGKPDPEESPLRYPIIKPDVRLELINETDMPSFAIAGAGIPLAMVHSSGGKLHNNDKYIPPSSSLASHPDLIGFFSSYINYLRELNENIFTIVSKLYAKDEPTPLAESVRLLCCAIVDHIDLELDEILLFGSERPPLLLIASAKRMARVINSQIRLLSGSRREELLKKIAEWSVSQPGEFENELKSLIDLEYIHHDLEKSLSKVMEFRKINEKLFKQLSLLDYPDKDKLKTDVFIHEKTDSEGDQKSGKSRNWEF